MQKNEYEDYHGGSSVNKLKTVVSLKDFQKTGRDFLLGVERGLLADDMGLGKSIQVISAAEKLEGDVVNVLYLCPASLCLNVEREIRKWVKDPCVVQIKNNKSEVRLTGRVRFVIASYNYIQQDHQVERLKKLKWHAIVADEAQKLKNWTTQTTKGFRKLVKNHTGRVWFLTGTPATNSGRDYYPFLEICQPGKWGTLSEFQELFCNKEIDYWSGAPKYTGVRDDKRKILRQAFKKITLRRLKEQVLPELPPKIVKELTVDIGFRKEETSFSYEDIVEMMKSGKINPAMKAERQQVGLKKVDAAVEYLLGCDEQVVVFTYHREVMRQIAEELGEEVGLISGDQTREEKDRAVELFQAKKLKYIICNLQAGALGLTLTAASHMLLVEFPWSPADLEQAYARIHRLTTTATCINITKLVAINSYDQKILDALEMKSEFMREVMNDNMGWGK